ncbi:hypothetical protein QE385_003286 [Sphingomonas sp. SORGH_AS 950]|nr:hypothetical protein [Sphingomonas sp. SORGH_AS_0950]
MERIWRREGLKVPQKQPKRGRLWLNDGSCIRLRPEYPGHVWAYDFVEGRTHDGRKFRILTIIDEASRECLALIVARRLNHEDVLASLADLFVERGPSSRRSCAKPPPAPATTCTAPSVPPSTRSRMPSAPTTSPLPVTMQTDRNLL